MKKALITGSEGNIGIPLQAYLANMGYELMTIDQKPGWRDGYFVADVRNAADLLPALDWKPDYVFHLAALYARVTCEQAAALAVETNVSGMQNVLELCKKTGAKLVYVSTSEVYGPGDKSDEQKLPRPNNRYGLTKLLAEYLVEYEVRQYGLKAVTLRPFTIYDEHEDFGDHRSAMIRFAEKLALRLPIEVHRGAMRGWLHINDALACIEAATRVNEYCTVNIGHPDVRPILELAHMLADRLKADPKLVQEKEIPVRMSPVKYPDLTRQKELLGITPKVSLEQGVDLVCRQVLKRLAYEGRLTC